MNAARRALPVDDAPLLEAERLALEVGERWLCCEFSLSLAAGECLVLLGPNGAGKTTLLHTLAGLREPTVGEVRIGGLPYAAWPALEAARFRGLLAQQQPDPFAASVLETVLVGRHPHLGRWGWEGPQDVAIATLLTQAPRLFLLDEPLNHLDLHHQIAALELFQRLVREDGAGRGSVLVLHDINLAARYADQIILLDGRGGVMAGDRDTVLRANLLSQAFGHPLRRIEHAGRAVFLPD